MKRSILIQNPAYLKIKNKQLKIIEPETQRELGSIPCEDIGYLILEHPQTTITLQVIQELQNHKAAIISCDNFHIPQGLMLPFEGHSQMQEQLKNQINCSEALRKQLWKQTVQAKISNQQLVLQILGKPHGQMDDYLQGVKSGDSTNKEGQAANFYWKHLWQEFTRDRYGDMPNPLLNYGYAVLRSAVARALVSSGLNPSIGIFHKNKYNAFCLADDIMEPYRPFVDYLVYQLFDSNKKIDKISPAIKQNLLQIYTSEVLIADKTKLFMEAIRTTSASLSACFAQTKRKIIYPEFYVTPKPF
ncbi:MAG: type II CRISPR-associated endonuclease Cas1 [Flavobacteriales bacterium]|jgi:CRISPR-associated protein Cas1|nr:type II CRISPR-associated endonuclease Cas1 [Flavobacteriales bacterium]